MLLSAIGIFMVVDSHTFTALDMFGDYIPYNSFFMPMFVFISGYFNKVDPSTKLLPYIGKKIRTLLVPYAGISVIVYVIQQLMALFKGGERMPLSGWYLMYVLDRVVTVGSPYAIAEPMWFVITLFSLLLIYAIFKKLLGKIWNSYVMLVIFCALNLFTVHLVHTAETDSLYYLLLPLKVLFFLPFLELGMIYRDHLEKKHDAMSGGAKVALMALMLVINAVRTLYLPVPYDLACDRLNELAGFTSPYILTPIVSALVGITFWLTLAGLLEGKLGESRFINYMSCNTFWIMGLHIVFFNVLNCILMAINEYVAVLPYFDTEYFSGSEWYYWEYSPDFKIVYVLIGVLGPLSLKWIFDAVCGAVGKVLVKKTA